MHFGCGTLSSIIVMRISRRFKVNVEISRIWDLFRRGFCASVPIAVEPWKCLLHGIGVDMLYSSHYLTTPMWVAWTFHTAPFLWVFVCVEQVHCPCIDFRYLWNLLTSLEIFAHPVHNVTIDIGVLWKRSLQTLGDYRIIFSFFHSLHAQNVMWWWIYKQEPSMIHDAL